MIRSKNVSIVIPTLNRSDLLHSCLEAVSAQTRIREVCEIIVVNDGGEAVALSNIGVSIKYIEQVNCGPAAARNIGARQASGEILVFLDDDCVPAPNWLEMLLEVYDSNPEVSGVVGTLVAGAGSSVIGKWEAQEFVQLFNKLNSVFGTTFDVDGRVWFHFGCNSSYKQEAFLEAGGYNEKMRLMEDTDLHWRLFENDVPLYYTPRAVVEHNCRKTFFGEFRRCYKCGIAYRSFCASHPGYRELLSRVQSDGGGLVKGTIAALARASSYAPSLGMKCCFVLVSLVHKLMYFAGYLASRKANILIQGQSPSSDDLGIDTAACNVSPASSGCNLDETLGAREVRIGEVDTLVGASESGRSTRTQGN